MILRHEITDALLGTGNTLQKLLIQMDNNGTVTDLTSATTQDPHEGFGIY